MEHDKTVGERQPDAGSPIVAGKPAVDLYEGLEDHRLVLRRNADSAIPHGEAYTLKAAVAARLKPEFAAVGHEPMCAMP
jgi:hypothetical protein